MADFFEYPCKYLGLSYTLTCGQAFRWKIDPDGWWTAPVQDQLIRIRHRGSGFEWETYPEQSNETLLRSYFRLDDNVPAIFTDLSNRDTHIANLIIRYKGLRLLRQDPTETLLSYVCSTANSVPRISRSIELLSQYYGELITEIAGREYYSFPAVRSIASADPEEMSKTCHLGFRARNLVLVAQQLLDRETSWLPDLRMAGYETAKAELTTIRGVGSKIADCVCLFSLNKDEAVPVDTHIRQITVKHFIPDLRSKTMTAGNYQRIADYFRRRYGSCAGWAQQYLYLEDLSRRSMRVSNEQESAEMISEHE